MFGMKPKPSLAGALAQANERLAANELLMRDQAVLVSIVSDNGINRFTFVRNGVLTQIETFGVMFDNVAEWRKVLLERQP